MLVTKNIMIMNTMIVNTMIVNIITTFIKKLKLKTVSILILIASISLITGCKSIGEKLNSSNRNEAIQSARKILEKSSKPMVSLLISKGDIPEYFKALSSDNRLVVEAAQKALIRLSNASMNYMLSNMFTPEYKNHKLKKRLDIAQKIVAEFDKPAPYYQLYYESAKLYASIDKKTGITLLQQALSQTNIFSKEVDKAKAIAHIADGYYEIDKNRAVSLFSNSIKIAGKLKRERDRLDAATNIANLLKDKIADKEIKAFEKSVVKLLRSIVSFTGRPKALGSLAVMYINSDSDKTVKIGKSIYTGYNKKEAYNEIVKIARQLAKKDPKQALKLYDTGYNLALSFKRDKIAKPLFEIASNIISIDINRAKKILGKMPFSENYHLRLLKLIAVEQAKYNMNKAIYAADLIIYPNHKAEVLGKIAAYIAKTNINNAFMLTNRCSITEPIQAQIAIELAKSQVPKQQAQTVEILSSISIDTTNWIRYNTEAAIYYTGTNIQLAKSIYKKALSTVQMQSNDSTKIYLLSIIVDNLANICHYDTTALWREAFVNAATITNEKLKNEFITATVEKLTAIDRVGASYAYSYLKPSAISSILAKWLKQDILLAEKTILIANKKNAVKPLQQILTTTSDCDKIDFVLDVLQEICKDNGLYNETSYDPVKSALRSESVPDYQPILSILRSTNSPFMCKQKAIRILAKTSDQKIFTAYINIITNKEAKALHSDVITVLSDKWYLSQLKTQSSNLIKLCKSQKSAVAVKQNAVILLGNIGGEKAKKAIFDLLKKNPPTSVAIAAINTLAKLKDKKAIPLIKRYLSRPNVYYTAIEALSKLGTTADLIRAYRFSQNKQTIAEMLALYAPSKQKLKKIAIIGSIDDETVWAFQIRGYNCIITKDTNEAKAKNCKLFLVGEYRIEFDAIGFQYVDNKGTIILKNEIHQLTIKLKNFKSPWSLWYCRATGVGSYWGKGVDDLDEDPKEVIHKMAEKLLKVEFHRQLGKKKATLPLNY